MHSLCALCPNTTCEYGDVPFDLFCILREYVGNRLFMFVALSNDTFFYNNSMPWWSCFLKAYGTPKILNARAHARRKGLLLHSCYLVHPRLGPKTTDGHVQFLQLFSRRCYCEGILYISCCCIIHPREYESLVAVSSLALYANCYETQLRS